MVWKVCKIQFSCRNIGFRCKEEEKDLFYKTQWSDNQVVFLVYRSFMCFYSLGWVIAWYISYGIRSPDVLAKAYRYFTVWAEAANAIYFSLAFILSAVGVARGKRSNRLEHKATKLLRSLTWMFFGPACTIQIIMVIMFWGFLIPNLSPGRSMTPFDYHQHLITVIMILIDVFVAAFPIRLLHYIYSVLGGLIYITMTLILHATGTEHSIYPFLNWAENAGVAAGVSVGLCFIGTALTQLFVFGLYLLRLRIFKSICNLNAVVRSETSSAVRNGSKLNPVDNACDNPAYSFRTVIRKESLPQASDYF